MKDQQLTKADAGGKVMAFTDLLLGLMVAGRAFLNVVPYVN